MKSTAYFDVPLDSLLRSVDLTELNTAIQAVPNANKLSPFDLREVEDSILIAADTWLARDLQAFSSVQTETQFNDGKVIIDLIGVNQGTLAPFNKYPNGTKILIDWKTSAQPVDTETFKRRHIGSFQWQKYAVCVPDSTLFIYRGLSRSLDFRKRGDNFEPASRTRELILKVHPGIEAGVINQWSGVLAQRDALINISPWPRNRDSCYAFGSECPFYASCYADTSPLKIPELTSNLSYSKMALFLRCPERYRLSVLAEQTDTTELDEDAGTLAGSVIHAGLANLWEQAFRNRENNLCF